MVRQPTGRAPTFSIAWAANVPRTPPRRPIAAAVPEAASGRSLLARSGGSESPQVVSGLAQDAERHHNAEDCGPRRRNITERPDLQIDHDPSTRASGINCYATA